MNKEVNEILVKRNHSSEESILRAFDEIDRHSIWMHRLVIFFIFEGYLVGALFDSQYGLLGPVMVFDLVVCSECVMCLCTSNLKISYIPDRFYMIWISSIRS